MIAIFDSGLGGLDFAKIFRKKFPDYDFLYLGDQLRLPYGNRSQEAVLEFTENACLFLWSQKVELIIIACNTASSEALRVLQNKYPHKKILGVLVPGVEAVMPLASNKKHSVGVVGTKGTIASKAYTREIMKRVDDVEVVEVATPLLVPFIEEMKGKSPECRKILKNYLRPLKDAGVKNIILGCTHYNWIQPVFKKIMGPQVQIISPASEAVDKLKIYLEKHNDLDQKLSKNSKEIFYTTDCPKNFTKQLEFFYGKGLEVKKISVLRPE